MKCACTGRASTYICYDLCPFFYGGGSCITSYLPIYAVQLKDCSNQYKMFYLFGLEKSNFIE